MKISNASFACLVFLTLAFCADVVVAQKFKLPFRSSKADSNSSQRLSLSQNDGPWLIMCASFVGDDGPRQANNLAQELRQKYRLKAYTYRHEFDFAQNHQGIGWEVTKVGGKEDIIPKRMKTKRDIQFEEIAVLVGDFPSVDHSHAQKTLKNIKAIQPESLANFDAERGTSQKLRMWREIVKKANPDSEAAGKGPLSAAFLLPNPLLPDEYFKANRVDHFVLKLNKNVRHSLLENESTYSVRVASFRGDSTFKLNEIDQKEREHKFLKRMGKPVGESKLAQAADNANKLTKELRRLGIEAYEFHDRHESYVCVGSFDWISKTDQSGKKIFNQDVIKTINTFKATVEDLPELPGAVRPQVLPKFRKTNIVFDPQPVPVLVPQANVSSHASRMRRWR